MTMTLEEYLAKEQAEEQEFDAKIDAALALVTGARAVELVGSDGRKMLVTPSIAEPGKWQLTWFYLSQSGESEPWGHSVMSSIADAVRSAMGKYGTKSYGPPHGDRTYRVTRVR